KQTAVFVDSLCEGGNKKTIYLDIEGSKVNSVLFRLGIGVFTGEIEKMLAIGKKERPAVRGVEFWIEMRDSKGRTTRSWNLIEGAERPRRENDDAARAQRTAAPRTGHITQCANHAGADLKCFQLQVSEKPDA